MEDGASNSQNGYHWWRSTSEYAAAGDILRPTSEGGDVTKLDRATRIVKEMERLAMVADESLDDLRHKLISYRSGDLWVPIGGLTRNDIDVPPMITVLLVGSKWSGKSSLVNLMYSVLGRAGLIPFAQTCPRGDNDGTKCLEEHNVLRSPRSGFCLFDSRGLDNNRMEDGLDEVADWTTNGVRHRQICGEDGLGMGFGTRRFVKRRVNCPLVVASLSEIVGAYKDGNLRPLEATKEIFHSPSLKIGNEAPILILTQGDQLHPEDRIEGRLKICKFLGISETSGVYDIACLNERGLLVDEFDPTTAYALSEAIYRALMLSDRNHPPKKKAKDYLLVAFAWVLWTFFSFFALLAYCFSRLAHKGKQFKMQ